MALSLIGIGIIIAEWRWAVFHLYALPAQSIAAFTSITVNANYVIGAIVIFMVTGKLIYDWKNTTVTTIAEEAKNVVIERTPKAEHFDGDDIP